MDLCVFRLSTVSLVRHYEALNIISKTGYLDTLNLPDSGYLCTEFDVVFTGMSRVAQAIAPAVKLWPLEQASQAAAL